MPNNGRNRKSDNQTFFSTLRSMKLSLRTSHSARHYPFPIVSVAICLFCPLESITSTTEFLRNHYGFSTLFPSSLARSRRKWLLGPWRRWNHNKERKISSLGWYQSPERNTCIWTYTQAIDKPLIHCYVCFCYSSQVTLASIVTWNQIWICWFK